MAAEEEAGLVGLAEVERLEEVDWEAAGWWRADERLSRCAVRGETTVAA